MRKIQIVVRMCDGTSNTALRPVGFEKEKCFQNLLTTKDEMTNVTVFFDGNPKNHFVSKYSVPIVEFSDGGSDAKSMRGLVQYLIQQQYDPETILYIVEDDFYHRPGWPSILREAFSGTMQPSLLQPTYVTLYVHLDKYDHPMYTRLLSMIGITKSIHWRTVPSTVNTCAMLFKSFQEDFDVFYKYTCIDDTYAYDNDKYLELGRERGRIIMSCIPGYSTHMQTNVLAPCVDWSAY